MEGRVKDWKVGVRWGQGPGEHNRSSMYPALGSVALMTQHCTEGLDLDGV